MIKVGNFEAIKGGITLHGSGFIQVVLPNNTRMHVWHPGLPRTTHSPHGHFHNHRFSFKATVLKGNQVNQRCDIIPRLEGTHTLISHDGDRLPSGARESYPVGQANVVLRSKEMISPGQSYYTPELEYHHTPNQGFVITLMEKLSEGTIHASSVIEKGYAFDDTFDRFQFTPAELWQFVAEAFEA